MNRHGANSLPTAMTSPELFLLSVLRALVEVALLTLLGQGLLALLAGKQRSANPVYRLFQVVTSPAIQAVRRIMPKRVADRHVPPITFFLLFWVWIFLAYVKRLVCLSKQLGCLA